MSKVFVVDYLDQIRESTECASIFKSERNECLKELIPLCVP